MSEFKYHCSAKRCAKAPCPSCHQRGPCRHCHSGERKKGCRSLTVYMLGKPKPKPDAQKHLGVI